MSKAALRYHGSKWRMSGKIIALFPHHDCYVEPYSGAASVLLNKAPCARDVYNDLDDRIVNFFSVIRDDEQKLTQLIRDTPYSRTEFQRARSVSEDRFEDARRIYVLSALGFSSDACTRGDNTGFRSHPDSIVGFGNVEHFTSVKRRLRNVVIECMPALDVIEKYDSPSTLHYVDPPYLKSTRANSSGGYRHEMSDDEHIDLADCLKSVSGFVVLSGYRSELYEDLYPDWESYSLDVNCQSSKGNSVKTECIWVSPSTTEDRRGRLI